MLLQWLRNMGFRYVLFRIGFEVQKRTGLLKIRFPKYTENLEFISLLEWRNLSLPYFKPNFPALYTLKNDADLGVLRGRVKGMRQNKFQWFSGKVYELSDWHTNPVTGYRYHESQHWSEIPDFLPEAGDIKYVWEKSRFCFLYDIIRYDFYFGEDQSDIVLYIIENWIDMNPVNCGPNWKCSQEISLRVLNWTFALQYYKHSHTLTADRLMKILNSVYRQMQHVYAHAQFAKNLVRNNHAIAEALALYSTGLMYPFFAASTLWKEKGKVWFENEVGYQLDPSGTYLQHSMNYHRMVVQLLTGAIQMAHLHGEQWSDTVYSRARQCVLFLRKFQDEKTGWLPNYGNNDGTLFMPLSNGHYRDFRPQLNALAKVLDIELGYTGAVCQEEALWLGISKNELAEVEPYTSGVEYTAIHGYYSLKEASVLTFIRCGSYTHRPFQSDNLHIEIWVNGDNILRDAGSYSYFDEDNTSNYFTGTASHNTVMLANFDQMKKGPHFMWDQWITWSKGGWRVGKNRIRTFLMERLKVLNMLGKASFTVVG